MKALLTISNKPECQEDLEALTENLSLIIKAWVDNTFTREIQEIISFADLSQ